MNIYFYLLCYFVFSAIAKPLASNEEKGDKESRDYDGFQVITSVPDTEDQLLAVTHIKTNMTEECDLDWWSGPSSPGLPVSVLVPPACVDTIVTSLTMAGMEFNITLEDLQDTINKERQYRWTVMTRRWNENWVRSVYHNLAEIRERTDWLVSAHPSLITKHTLATSHEGRTIDVLHLSQPGTVVRKPAIWLDCGIHSREWVSPPACLHAIETLVLDTNAVDPRDNLLAAYDFYILPLANPDGYVYSWTSDRMWRKNRRPTGQSQPAQPAQFPGWGGGFGQGWGQQQVGGGQSSSSRCSHGVDPNRNFAAIWEQASDNKCDQSYKGNAPFSEPESQAIKKGVEMMKRDNGQIAAFISIHAYSQFWMSPYGYSYNKPQDYNDHMSVMKIAVNALESKSGTRYKYGPISDIIYQAFGSSVDWAYDQGIKYSFALELRDTGYKGFLLPQDQIEATVEETWEGLKAMAWAIGPEFGIHV